MQRVGCIGKTIPVTRSIRKAAARHPDILFADRLEICAGSRFDLRPDRFEFTVGQQSNIGDWIGDVAEQLIDHFSAIFSDRFGQCTARQTLPQITV